MTLDRPTIIVVHPRENRKKCSVEPLRGHPDFRFWTFPNRGDEPLDGYVRLGIGGQLIGPDDASRGLLVLDATWKLAGRMEPFFADLPIRSLPAWHTAYPRFSKTFADPAAGLATIEAIYAALTEMQLETHGLLDQYYWAEEFLRRNAGRIA